ncbi:MAG TPA: hypothetical protein VF755_16850 [Catenuloplanes sp.]|jgi:hypothetical protein
MTLPRLARLLTLGAAALACAVPAGPAHAQAPAPPGPAGGITVGVRPSDEAEAFHVNLVPGEQSDRVAVVSNLSATPVDLLIYPAAATNTAQGGFALAPREEPLRQVGSWTTLQVSSLHMAARTSASVKFRVDVPAHTTPGDYAGGILIQRTEQGRPAGSGNDLALKVNVVQRVGVRIYLRVAGQVEQALSVGALTWKQGGRGGTYSLPVTNTGNVRLKPSGQVVLNGFRLPSEAIAMSRIEELLPGSSVVVTGTMPERPLYGWGDAVATVQYGEGQQATAVTRIRFVAWLPTLLGSAALVVVALGLWRFLRFVRRARVALRQAGQATAA